MKKPTVFITIEFANIVGLFDYPKHLPVPSKNDIVILDGKSGRVVAVRHVISGNVAEITIVCAEI